MKSVIKQPIYIKIRLIFEGHRWVHKEEELSLICIPNLTQTPGGEKPPNQTPSCLNSSLLCAPQRDKSLIIFPFVNAALVLYADASWNQFMSLGLWGAICIQAVAAIIRSGKLVFMCMYNRSFSSISINRHRRPTNATQKDKHGFIFQSHVHLWHGQKQDYLT